MSFDRIARLVVAVSLAGFSAYAMLRADLLWPLASARNWWVLAPIWVPGLLATFAVFLGLSQRRTSRWLLAGACLGWVLLGIFHVWELVHYPGGRTIHPEQIPYVVAVFGLWLHWKSRRGTP